MIPSGLSVITLGVRHFDRALAFYRDGLGWPARVNAAEQIAFFDLGGVLLALYPREALARDITVSGAGSGFVGVALAYNAPSEADVDSILQTVAALGARIVKPAQEVFWGGYSGYFEDPEGFVWEVVYNPFWELDENGKVLLPKRDS